MFALRPPRFEAKYLMPIVSIVLCLVLIEIGLRLIKPPATFLGSLPCLFTEDETLGFRSIPNAYGRLQIGFEIDNEVTLNALGFHDIPQDPAQTSERPRILVLGDSFVTAAEVPIPEGMTQTIERELADKDVSVINLGISGTGIDQHLKLLQQYAPQFKPDVVVLAFYRNDIEDMLLKRKLVCVGDYVLVYQTEAQKQELLDFIHKNQPGPTAQWLAENWYLYRAVVPYLARENILLRTNTITLNHAGIPPEPAETVKPDQVDNLFKEFQALAEMYDFQFVIVPIPDKHEPTVSLKALEEYVSPSILAEIPVLDVYPTMKAQFTADGRTHQEIYFVYDNHFTGYGYRLLGEAMAEAIRPYLSAATP